MCEPMEKQLGLLVRATGSFFLQIDVSEICILMHLDGSMIPSGWGDSGGATLFSEFPFQD